MLTVNKKHIFTIDELNTVLETEDSIIIYGAGGYGKRVADYIFSIGKQSKIKCFYVTDRKRQDEYRGIRVLKFQEGNAVWDKNCLIVIAVSFSYLFDIADLLQQYQIRYSCVTKDLYRELGRQLGLDDKKTVPYRGLDFLLAGFPRCGTTSMYKALQTIDDLYLPDEKDISFFYWCDKVKGSKEWFCKNYFNGIGEEQIVGMFDVGLAVNPEKVYGFFGGRTKILFLVRNPVKAIFSNFKMYSCGGGVPELMGAYQKYGGYTGEEVFEECFHQNKGHQLVEMMNYIKWIRQYMEYYPKDQIKVLIFEEMIKNPEKHMNEVLQFLGSSCKFMQSEMPWVNGEDAAIVDPEGLKTADRFANAGEAYHYYPGGVNGQSCEEVFSQYMEIKKQYDQIKKVCNLKLSERMRKKLEMYYDESVRELESWLNKDLRELWF